MNVFALMRRYTIRTRMMGAIAMVLGLLGLLGAAGMVGMARINAVSEAFVNTSFSKVSLMAELRSQMGAIRQHEKDAIIQYESPETVVKILELWRASIKDAKATADKLLKVKGEAEDQVTLDIITKLDAYAEKFAFVAKQLESNGYDTATIANRMAGRAIAEFAEADKLMQQLSDVLRKEVDSAIEEQKQVSQTTSLMFLGVLGFAVIAVVPLTILNMQSICKPLSQACRIAEAIAGGDLSQEIRVTGEDEVAELQKALSDMQSGLNRLVAQVRDSSGSIATASAEIASGNQDLSMRTEQTASNAQEAVSTLSALTSNVQQTASASQMANQLAASASAVATKGGTVVEQAVSSMHEISASSRKINDIIGLIDSIAFQTNILALNAAVEAARAGEQGRGFAVVASEVRSLAQRSAAAASDIKTLIKSSVSAVDGGVRHVEQAGSAMREIVASIQRVGDIIAEISSASSEQSSGISQANQSVGEIDRMTQQNAALVEESAAAAESMREQAVKLDAVVHQFRLGSAYGVGYVPEQDYQSEQLALSDARDDTPRLT
jgi:methyl-accepting chemotaxis protein